MQLTHLLKKLQYITPAEDFTAAARAQILSTLPSPPAPPRVAWRFVLQSMQFGSAIALTSLLLVLVLGGFSVLKFLTPLRLSSLDPAGLRAEAQAIDIQINLANLKYAEELSPGASSAVPKNAAEKTDSADPGALSKKRAAIIKPVPSRPKSSAGLDPVGEPANINDLLEELSK